MAPPVEGWSARELQDRARVSEAGTWRKGFDGDLKKCELLEMLQYNCEVEKPASRDSLVRCWPVERLFRRCMSDSGSFMAETTAWEERGKRVG